ncbi:hypothetical protein HKD37_15G041479 [Glycine soja]
MRDPYAHLATYIEICNTVKITGVSEDAINLNLFSFSLAGEAKRWFHSFKGNSLQTWDEMMEKFLKKYFSKSKTVEGKVEISSSPIPHESLSEVLDRFHGLLRKTPTHGFSESVQLNIFINDLQPHSKQLLDASAGGKIKLKTPKEAMELIENTKIRHDGSFLVATVLVEAFVAAEQPSLGAAAEVRILLDSGEE